MAGDYAGTARFSPVGFDLDSRSRAQNPCPHGQEPHKPLCARRTRPVCYSCATAAVSTDLQELPGASSGTALRSKGSVQTGRRLTVDQEIVGSIPTSHPTLRTEGIR